MTKIEKARCVVMMTDAIRDVLLANLNGMPEEWDGFEVRQAVLEVCQGMVSDLKPASRRLAFEAAFHRAMLDRDRFPASPDARYVPSEPGLRGKPAINIFNGRRHDVYPVEEG